MKNKNNRLHLRTFGIIAGGFLVFWLVLSGMTKLVDSTTGPKEESPFLNLLTLIEVGNILFKSSLCVLVSYLVLKLFFKNTLARHIGDSFDRGWDNFEAKDKTAAVIFAFLILFLAASNIARGATLPVSQKGIDLITYYEVGGKSYYEKRLSRPTVPAWRTTSSGVTVGFGFDVGWNSKAQIKTACEGILSSSEIKALQSVAGLKGKRAYYALYKVKNRVHVSWKEAEAIFQRDSLPRYSRLTEKAFELDEDTLHPHCNGALVSLVFNRGSKIDYGNRRKEMAWIRHNIKIGKAERVPGNIRSMKRLWSYRKLKGLHLRRDAEARLFQQGLNQ